MKPGYKIIIALLVIYVGVKIKSNLEISPYKNRIKIFVSDLKDSKYFQAQDILDIPLQSKVSIQRLIDFAKENNISNYNDISFGDWDEDDNNYSLEGIVEYADDKDIQFDAILKKDSNSKIRIKSFRLNNDTLDTNSSDF